MTGFQVGLRQKKGVSAAIEVGDLLINYLEQLNVDYVFGIPGGAIEPLYNALARSERRGSVRIIGARHEASSAFMADGYYRNSGKLGVCCATTGPGATNLITGVASAYANNVPMLVITAQTALSTFGRGAFQESSCTGVNTVGLFEHCTLYNSLVSHIEQFEHKLAAAVMTAFQSPCGPVHLSIPIDVMRSISSVTEPSFDLSRLLQRPFYIDDVAVDSFCQELISAKKAVFLIGDEAGEAIGSILTLAMRLESQVLTTPHGKGLVSPYHPLFRGVIGFAGHDTARQVLADPEVDLVIAVGSGLTEWASDGWDSKTLLNRQLIHVESVESNLTRSPMAKLHVRGRLVSIFDRILTTLDSGPNLSLCVPDQDISGLLKDAEKRSYKHFSMIDEEKCHSDATPIKPQRLMHELPKLFPTHTLYLADTGSSFAWSTHYLHPFDRRVEGKRNTRNSLFRACLEFSSMGWAIGSAIGTALTEPGRPVVCITGDGSVLMTGQEITVAVQEKLPVIFVVLNDSGYGMVRHGQRLTGAEEIGVDLPKTNFASLAKSMGADGYVIFSPQDLLDLDIDKIWKKNGPTLLDVRIDKTEIPPIGMRIDAIKQ